MLTEDEELELLELLEIQESEKTIDTDISFEEFCVNAGYHEPLAKQVEMKEFALDTKGVRMILGARGYGKTDYAVICGVAEKLKKNKNYSVLIVSSSKERNQSMTREISRAARLNGVTFDRDNSSLLRVEGHIGKDHSVSHLTILATTFRGRHPDLVIMDDPVTEDDDSESRRRKVKKKYSEIVKLVQNVLIIGQPVHHSDLYQDLRDLALVKKLEMPHGTIPELDHDLEAMRLVGVSEKSIQASYFLKLISDSDVPFEKVNSVQQMPEGESFAFLDPSFKGGDFSALSIFKGYFDGIAVHGKAWKRAWYNCVDALVDLIVEHNIKRVCIETNSLGDQPVYTLRDKLAEMKIYGVTVVGRDSTANKHSRILAAGQYAESIFIDVNSDTEYIKQVKQYEHGAKYDDCPDSLATGMECIGLIRGKQKIKER